MQSHESRRPGPSPHYKTQSVKNMFFANLPALKQKVREQDIFHELPALKQRGENNISSLTSRSKTKIS